MPHVWHEIFTLSRTPAFNPFGELMIPPIYYIYITDFVSRSIAGREMPQIHGNWALGDKFLQFCMMLHMGIRYSKTTANKVG